MKKHVIVTGGGGYIGSHICRHLAIKGYTPVTVDNFITGHKEAVRWGPLVEADITHTEALDRAFEIYKPEMVYHLAGLSQVAEAQSYPDRYLIINTLGTYSLLNAMKKASVRRLVFASSSAVYGNPSNSSVASERTLTVPSEVYGASKFAAETVIQSFCKYHALTAVALRFFNVAGAAGKEIGEHHVPETHLVPRLIQAAMTGEPFEIYGEDYPTLDGTCVRDYVHVEDIARAHELAGIFTKTHMGFTAINLGTGNGYSVMEVVSAVERVTGQRVALVSRPRRPGDVAARVSSNEKAKLLLNWAPTKDIDDMVRSAYEWHMSLTTHA